MDCNAILSQGIYDYSRTTSNHELSLAFVNWFRSSEYSSLQDARSRGGSATIPIEGVMVGLGFEMSDENFQEFKKEVENYENLSVQRKDQFDQTLQTINPQVIEAWERCTTQDGVHLWIKFTENPYEFVIGGNYRDAGEHATPKIRNIEFRTGTVEPNADGFFMKKDGRINTKTVLARTELEQIFIRKSDSPVTIIVTPTMGGNLRASLPSIPAPPEPCIGCTSVTKGEIILHSSGVLQCSGIVGPYDRDVKLKLTMTNQAKRTSPQTMVLGYTATVAETNDTIRPKQTTADSDPNRGPFDFGDVFYYTIKRGKKFTIVFDNYVDNCTATGIQMGVEAAD